MNKLKQSTIEALKYYVYLLRDPDTHEIFYVGKGKGNRINSHGNEALDKLVTGDEKSKKIKRIRKILGNKKEVDLVVLRHGLKEDEAFEIEAAVIDLLRGTLTNIVSGHDSDERGMMSLKDIELKYQAEEAKFKHSAMLITINEFTQETSDRQLYERTRSAWKASMENAQKVEVVCAVYRGIVREVYVPETWFSHPYEPGRIYFEGKKAQSSTRSLYLDKSVKGLIKQGASNPIKYVWVNEK